MALFGQAPDAIMQTALAAIQFYDVQQQVIHAARETRLADKAIQMKEQCNKKLTEVHNAYQNVRLWTLFRQVRAQGTCHDHVFLVAVQAKRKYQATQQEKAGLEQENAELQDKYRQKSK
jgi:hypothetical protein